MGRTIGIGIQNFEKLISEHCFYVDKTDFIKEWWENKDEVTLITRPRRFGKTLNMNMLDRFLSVEYKNLGQIFEGLSIWNDRQYRQLQGTRPVIFLSFADVKASTFALAKEKICLIIRKLYSKYDFLLNSGILREGEPEFFRSFFLEPADSAISCSIKELACYLSRYYGKKAVILLDEYDTPLQEAWMYGYWPEMAEFIRGLFNSTFKTNPYLERALMTGITRVSRESIFSDLNHLEVVTSTSEKYASCFGFTEEEVTAALKEYELYQNKPDIKDWYNGFVFGKSKDIYNPWSIINYLDKKRLSTYWANTSSNSLIDQLVREGSAEVKLDMENLLTGKDIFKEIDEQIVFDQLYNDENAIWGFMLACGYLKAKNYTLNKYTGEELYQMALTNKEVRIMFQKMIKKWFSGSKTVYNGFIKALLNDDRKAMNTYMNKTALTTFSYFDSGKKPSKDAEPERFYHGFVLGLTVELADRYAITSNRESGLGRYDVMLEPRHKEDDAIILEFKVHDPTAEETLEDTAQDALNQIERQNYAAALKARGFSSGQIRTYGFAFEGKKVLIR